MKAEPYTLAVVIPGCRDYQQADGTPLPCGSACERPVICSICKPGTQPCCMTRAEIADALSRVLR